MNEWVRSDIQEGAVKYLAETPQIHIHYLHTDEEAGTQGFSRAELCCHGCGAAVVLTFAFPLPDGSLHRHLEAFTTEHRDCPDVGGAMLCPLARTSTVHLDLR